MMDFGANNGSAITANPDMVQEVRVQTSNYAAEHGSSAVQISATTKSGSKTFTVRYTITSAITGFRPMIARTASTTLRAR